MRCGWAAVRTPMIFTDNRCRGQARSSPLPVDGRPLYVNLFSSINNQWQKSTSYVYTALDNKARMLTPASSGTFTSSSGTFTWSAGTGASAYSLWVGSTPGAYDLYGQFVSGTSQVVTLPTDGQRVYVRLYSMMSGQWSFNGYTYNDFSGTDPKAEMTSPINGGTFTSTSGTFTWSAGTGASAYSLWVGSAVDTYDIFGQQVTGTSQVVQLPADGQPVYADLWSMIGGAWKPNRYVFTAATQGSPENGLITSPANGSILNSGTLALAWNAGSGTTPEYYSLWVGSTSGTSDLYGTIQGTNLSQTVQVPLDGGRIYITFWSWINGSWQPVYYYFDTTQ